jgi:hypothetical protein
MIICFVMNVALLFSRQVLLLAWRSRLWLAMAGVALLLFLAARLMGASAMTENTRTAIVLYGAFARLAVAFLVAAFVTVAVTREEQERGLEWVLALPLPRAAPLVGNALGYLAVAAGCAGMAALPLLAWAAPAAVLGWALSLAMEACVVALLALLGAVTLRRAELALAFTAGAYALMRSLGTLLVMARGEAESGAGLMDRLATWFFNALHALLPNLGDFAPTAWLVGLASPWAALPGQAVQAALALLVLAAAAWIDFERKAL